ncbi:MAG: anti-sigma factor [Cryobacterium sp.]
MTDRASGTPNNDRSAGTSSQDNLEDLVGAYALNALSAHDGERFAHLLTESEQARIEAEGLSHAAVALGLATTPVQPSAGLKASIMSQLAATPQLAPLPRPVAPPVTHGEPSAVPTAPPAPSGSPVTAGSAAERAQTRWFQRPVRLLVASAAAVALFVGGTVIGQTFNDAGEFAGEQASSLARINAASDSDRAATTTRDGQAATLVWSNSLGLSAVLLEDLPELPANQDYQLWYINAAGPLPAGTFDSSGEGTAWRVLDGTMRAGDAVGVTVEPDGGSDQPTTDPIVAFQS